MEKEGSKEVEMEEMMVEWVEGGSGCGGSCQSGLQEWRC